ncbi:hypothetical protein O9K51_04911 [Purpureocillium lavendulum]|uniref:Uncharacterized protein n=1 Tax=Purpureocillium lavendulum TaxID=1247861 RepID=A0AB34FRA3_9HYPO|nr:hypothetical protein O9K51_04911 [Purpureocillium lavendulum]
MPQHAPSDEQVTVVMDYIQKRPDSRGKNLTREYIISVLQDHPRLQSQICELLQNRADTWRKGTRILSQDPEYITRRFENLDGEAQRAVRYSGAALERGDREGATRIIQNYLERHRKNPESADGSRMLGLAKLDTDPIPYRKQLVLYLTQEKIGLRQ